jgi:hypothetical protein
MATYSEIQKLVQRHHGFVPKPAWITRVEALRGLPTRPAANRAGRGRRVVPCPPEKREAIEQALRHFGLPAGPLSTGGLTVSMETEESDAVHRAVGVDQGPIGRPDDFD